MGTQLVSFLAAFVGSSVESVEALTIVLAVGVTRGWRSPLYGAGAALLALGVSVVVFGTLITARVPEGALKVAIGVLLLLFGLRWLRKAILRSAGVIAQHDEDLAYAETSRRLGGPPAASEMDWPAFATSFQGVFLEGVEVAFIVVAVGAGGHTLVAAAVGGIAAAAVVAGVGVLVRHPLARIPENTLKTLVGVVLTSLGTFWAAEGAGASWPGDLASLAVLILFYLAITRCAVAMIRGSWSAVAPAR